jgi:phosphoribosyl 1,2-cyclic phosphodiesterase
VSTLHILGSGSGGNAFAVTAAGESLLVDAGFSAREIARRAEMVGLELASVTGLILTHEHGDHTTGAARLARQFRIPIYASAGTLGALGARLNGAELRPLTPFSEHHHGPFVVEACPTTHDAAEPLAVVVRTTVGHRIGFAYDLGRPTTAVRYLLQGSHALVLEANHDEVLLRTSGYPPVVQERIAGATGHLSNRAAADLLEPLLHPGLSTIILAHLSERCNTAERAMTEIRRVVGTHQAIVLVALQEAPLPSISLSAMVIPENV